MTGDDVIHSTTNCEPLRSVLAGIPSDGAAAGKHALAQAIALAQACGSVLRYTSSRSA